MKNNKLIYFISCLVLLIIILIIIFGTAGCNKNSNADNSSGAVSLDISSETKQEEAQQGSEEQLALGEASTEALITDSEVSGKNNSSSNKADSKVTDSDNSSKASVSASASETQSETNPYDKDNDGYIDGWY